MNNRIYRNIDADGLRHCNETCTQAVYHGDKLLSEMLTSMMNRIAALEGGSGSGSSGDTPSGGGTSATTNWSGMYFSINGDSISTYKSSYMNTTKNKYEDGYLDLTSVDQAWWKIMVDGVGGTVLSNASVSGGTVSAWEAAYEDIREDGVNYTVSRYSGKCACSPMRISRLVDKQGTPPDVIVTLIGANDWGHSAPLGSWNGSTTLVEPSNSTKQTDFSKALGLMIKRMKTAYPNAKIVLCTCVIPKIAGWPIEEATGLQMNAQGLTIIPYNNRIKEIAANLNLGLIDLFNCGITVDNYDEVIGGTLPTGEVDIIHPNKAGMALMGAKAIADLKKL